MEYREWVRESCDTMGEELAGVPGNSMSEKPYIQDSPVGHVNTLRRTSDLTRSIEESEWPLERPTRLQAGSGLVAKQVYPTASHSSQAILFSLILNALTQIIGLKNGVGFTPLGREWLATDRIQLYLPYHHPIDHVFNGRAPSLSSSPP